MTLEERLTEALATFDAVDSTPDLFARVDRSVSADHRYVARRRSVILASIAAVLVLVATAWWLSDTSGDPITIAGWWIELVGLVLIASVTAGVGLLLRRIGRMYVAASFAATPGTGERLMALLDLAFYLVFSGAAVATVSLRDLGGGRDLFPALEDLAGRVGLVLLVMGGLHALTYTVLPVMGLVQAISRHRQVRGEPGASTSGDVRLAHRVVRFIVLGLVVLVAVELVFTVGLLIGGADG